MADPSETTQVSREPAQPENDELLGAVRALATQVGELQSELQTLRAQARSLPSSDGERPGWEDRSPMPRDSVPWVRSLDSPTFRRATVPWLVLEIAFLVAVAVLTAIADLSAPVVVAVMVGAWLLVALAEWTRARVARGRSAIVYESMLPSVTALSDDPSWFDPPVERTALDIGESSRSATTRLPPPID